MRTVLTYEISQGSSYGFDYTDIVVRSLNESPVVERIRNDENRGKRDEKMHGYLLAGEDHVLDKIYAVGDFADFTLHYQHYDSDGRNDYCEPSIRDVGHESLSCLHSASRFLAKVSRRIAKKLDVDRYSRSSGVHGWALEDPTNVIEGLEKMGAKQVFRPADANGMVGRWYLYYKGERHVFRTEEVAA